jgi:hypothetical protein
MESNGPPTTCLRVYAEAPLHSRAEYASKYPHRTLVHWLLQTDETIEVSAETVTDRAHVVPTPFWEVANASSREQFFSGSMKIHSVDPAF